jgi:hypothetical protein
LSVLAILFVKEAKQMKAEKAVINNQEPKPEKVSLIQ